MHYLVNGIEVRAEDLDKVIHIYRLEKVYKDRTVLLYSHDIKNIGMMNYIVSLGVKEGENLKKIDLSTMRRLFYTEI